MRYIGNKTKLLSFIGDFLDHLGLRHGHALDAFAGTVSVGAFLKARGFHVAACDVMTYSYVFQRAYLEVDEYPTFERLGNDAEFQRALRGDDFAARVGARFGGQSDLFHRPAVAAHRLEEVLVYLDSCVAPEEGFITRSFSASVLPTDGQRMYFTTSNGMRIDAIRRTLHAWRSDRLITPDEYHVLLTALIEAADAVANTTGVYAAFMKSWQSNAVRSLELKVPKLVVDSGRIGRAFLGDIAAVIEQVGHMDLLYLDPPYNTRQYSAYYHVPDIIAAGWFEGTPELRGKTGLVEDAHLKSDWSSRDRCVRSLELLLANASADHVLMSYNSEGIIPDADIERVLRSAGRGDSYRRIERKYARYRADSEGADRHFKADEVSEYLYYVRTR